MLITDQPRIKAGWSPVGRTVSRQSYYVVRAGEQDYREYWGNVIDPDGTVRDRFAEHERQQFIEDRQDEIDFVNALHPSVVLDFGCGPGWMLTQIDARRRIGIEVAHDALQHLSRTDIDVRGGMWDVADDECDVAIAYHVIEHMPDPIDTITHLRRALKPGGWLVIGTPDFGCPCAVRFGSNYRMLHDRTHCSLFTLESMHRFLRDFGFTIDDVRFPFPSRYATQATFSRWADTSQVSPPWPGNWMTFYAQRSHGGT